MGKNMTTLLYLLEKTMTETKPTKKNPLSAGKGVHLQKDLALASANPQTRGPVSRPLGQTGPGAAACTGQGRGRGRGPP